MQALFGTVSGVYQIAALISLVGCLFVLVDSVRRSEEVFRAAESNKWLWVALPIGGLLPFISLTVFGLVVTAIYLLDVRKRLQAVTGGRPPGGGWRS